MHSHGPQQNARIPKEFQAPSRRLFDKWLCINAKQGDDRVLLPISLHIPVGQKDHRARFVFKASPRRPHPFGPLLLGMLSPVAKPTGQA
jgi:hypothetical protein